MPGEAENLCDPLYCSIYRGGLKPSPQHLRGPPVRICKADRRPHVGGVGKSPTKEGILRKFLHRIKDPESPCAGPPRTTRGRAGLAEARRPQPSLPGPVILYINKLRASV